MIGLRCGLVSLLTPRLAAIHHIEPGTPEGLIQMSKQIIQLTESLIGDYMGLRSSCVDKLGDNGNGPRCCDGASMLADVASLSETLGVADSLTEKSTSTQPSTEVVISQAEEVSSK